MALFQIGRLVATPGALFLLDSHDVHPLELVDRHTRGDWGELCPEDTQTNEDAVADGGRLLSRYMVGDQSVYVITEGDRSATTVLLLEKY